MWQLSIATLGVCTFTYTLVMVVSGPVIKFALENLRQWTFQWRLGSSSFRYLVSCISLHSSLRRAYTLHGFGWKYYSSLSKIMQVWRSLARQIFLAWVRLHGADSALLHAKCLPPKVCSARWHGASPTEKRINRAGQDNLQPVFDAVLAATWTASGAEPIADDPAEEGKSAPTSAPGLDDIRAEATSTYRKTMGRWRKDVFNIMGMGSFVNSVLYADSGFSLSAMLSEIAHTVRHTYLLLLPAS